VDNGVCPKEGAAAAMRRAKMAVQLTGLGVVGQVERRCCRPAGREHTRRECGDSIRAVCTSACHDPRALPSTTDQVEALGAGCASSRSGGRLCSSAW